jgi:hypothetical protein
VARIQGGDFVISAVQSKRCREDHSEKIVRRVQGALQRNPYPLLRSLFFEYEGGVVILRGRLPSYYYKQLAQEALRGIDGVTHVVNEIEVSPSHSR